MAEKIETIVASIELPEDVEGRGHVMVKEFLVLTKGMSYTYLHGDKLFQVQSQLRTRLGLPELPSEEQNDNSER